MITPNIENIIKSLVVKADVMEMGEKIAWGSDTALMRQAAAALQAQAERIKELERESETHSKAYGLAIVERDNLRAQLAEIATTEPVATINDLGNARMFTLEANGYSRKDKLFTRPMPAQDVTELVEALERVLNCCDIAECSTVPNSPGALKNARTALSKYKGAK